MTVKLISSMKPLFITPSQMKDGQIGEIVSWTNLGAINRIVQRKGNSLICIGLPSGNHYPEGATIRDNSCLIRLLSKGEQIEIINN